MSKLPDAEDLVSKLEDSPDPVAVVRETWVAVLRWAADAAPDRKTLVHCRTLANKIERGEA